MKILHIIEIVFKTTLAIVFTAYLSDVFLGLWHIVEQFHFQSSESSFIFTYVASKGEEFAYVNTFHSGLARPKGL